MSLAFLLVLALATSAPPAGAEAKGQQAPAPSAVARAALPEGSTSSGWLPAELYLSSYVYLRGKINGVETDVLLDSGAGITVVDAALAERLELAKRGGSVVAQGAGGSRGAHFLEAFELELGPVALTIPAGIELDLGDVVALAGRGMPVILGREAFDALVVDIDYPRARVAFHAPESFAYAGPGRTLPLFPWKNGKKALEASVEGRPPARFEIDTGSNMTLDVFASFAEEHGLLAGRAPVSARQGGGVGATFVSALATLRSLDLGGYRLENVPAAFPRVTEGGFATEEIAGNIGSGVLARFRVIFDYSRARLHLEPGPDWDTRPFAKDRLGLTGVFRDGGIDVTFVAPLSPAEKNGWKPGQRITALAGEPVSAATWRAALRRLAESPAGTEIVLTDGEGKARKLVAAEYY